ncbi:MAG: IPTL-CTERM sorting domain-containing protein [Casimicrobiaceae bacterium]
MNKTSIALAYAALLGIATGASAAPTAVNGASFVLVANQATGVQLFELTSDPTGKVYAGNNSNAAPGIPVQLFDPALFTGTTVALQNFGPVLGDADGIAFAGGFLYVASVAGVERITVPGGVGTLFMPGIANNGTGSPIVVRPGDSHIFVGLGGLTGINRIDEYDAAGAFVVSHTTGTDVETMTFDPASGLIYYAPFGSAVRALNPVTNADAAVGSSSGTIDGALTFDALSGLLFVGTANGVNSGLVETINPVSGVTRSFASGFNGSLGILREPISGDLYFLEASQLYRLPSSAVNGALAPVVSGIPTLSHAALILLALLVLAATARHLRRA